MSVRSAGGTPLGAQGYRRPHSVTLHGRLVVCERPGVWEKGRRVAVGVPGRGRVSVGVAGSRPGRTGRPPRVEGAQKTRVH